MGRIHLSYLLSSSFTSSSFRRTWRGRPWSRRPGQFRQLRQSWEMSHRRSADHQLAQTSVTQGPELWYSEPLGNEGKNGKNVETKMTNGENMKNWKNMKLSQILWFNLCKFDMDGHGTSIVCHFHLCVSLRSNSSGGWESPVGKTYQPISLEIPVSLTAKNHLKVKWSS